MKKKILIPFILSFLVLGSCGSSVVPITPIVDTTVTVDLDTTTLSLSVGGKATINAITSNDSEVTWVYGGTNGVAKMEVKGNAATITGLENGTCYITAIAGISSQYCTVTVGEGGSIVQVGNIKLDRSEATIDLNGETLLLKATLEEPTVGQPTITWTSSNTSVATVSKQDRLNNLNETALVTPKGKGQTSITATAGGKTASCVITVEDYATETLAIKLNKSVLTLEVDKEETLQATVKPENTLVVWQSNNEGVATVDQNGKIKALKVGSATISASITVGEESKVATCEVTVKASGSSSDYDKQIAAWSKPGHLYLHYLRNSDSDYSKWALWIWQNYPKDGEGSLWGANTKDYTLAVNAQTEGAMTNADVGLSGSSTYIDEHGIVIDVDLTVQNLKGGKTGAISPLIIENDELNQWEPAILNKLALGFLIVDQSKMTGKDMWTSDGGAETYIKKLGTKMEGGKSGSLHVFCIEGSVSQFTTSSSESTVVENPTLNDKTGQYRSKNDITDLKNDAYKSGVATSTSFWNDTPGVGYQIFVPSFADYDGDGYGDLQGIIHKLDYLQDLGVEVLWLTPIQESNSYHGYDVTDYYKIDQRYGTLQDYQELIYKAHQRGMKVLMDMVINHTSKSNVLFQKSQRAEEGVDGKGNKFNYRDMYLWKYEDDPILEWDGVTGKYDADNPARYVTKKVQESDDWYRDGTSNYYYFGKFGSGMAELNYSCQATRDYMTDMCKYWLSFGLDGFRLDAIKHIYLLSELNPDDYNNNFSKNDYITYDVSYRTYYNEETFKEETVQNDYSYDRDLNVIFWKQFAGTIKSAYPNCFLVGENFDGWNERMAPFYESMDSQFDFSTYYHLNEKPFEGMGYDISNSLSVYRGYRAKAINGAYTSNHDIPRLLNHAAGHVEEYSASGNHHVEITGSNKDIANKYARIYAAYTLLTPGVSWIYYGDELGMSGNTSDKVADSTGAYVNDHGNNVDRWYRQPMRWGKTYGGDGGNDVKVVNYKFSGLEVLWDNYNNALATASEQKNDANSMFNLFKAAAKAKNDSKYPTYGVVDNYWPEVNGSLEALHVTDGTRTAIVFINHSGSVQNISALNQGTLIACSNGGSATSVGAWGFTVVVK